MDNKRRALLKYTGLIGAGMAGGSLFKGHAGQESYRTANLPGRGWQIFNMCGYSAPKLDIVRIAFIGTGNRGTGAVRRISKLSGVGITAIGDIRRERAENAQKIAADSGMSPSIYSDGEQDWQKLCQRDDIDLIYITTPWALHTPMALYAMEHGKHVCVEVPAATSLEEAWQLVETSERTRKHCMMLENCCYDFFELLTLNMARNGFFGEIIHCEGAYIHDILEGNFSKTKNYNFWRLKENAKRNGNLYPTHGLGPICQVMNINRGDRMDYLVSMSGNDFMMGAMAKQLAENDPTYQPYANQSFRGNMNTSIIRTVKGKTIMLQHDVTSPRPYSRIHLVSGTKGTALKYPLPGRISTNHTGWLSDEEMKALEELYTPPIVSRIGDLARRVGGHGGMDMLMDWRTIDCLRNGLPLDQDVYDAALWSCILPLTELSVNKRSATMDVPDFTRGSWKTNTPVDLLLERGANTEIRA